MKFFVENVWGGKKPVTFSRPTGWCSGPWVGKPWCSAWTLCKVLRGPPMAHGLGNPDLIHNVTELSPDDFSIEFSTIGFNSIFGGVVFWSLFSCSAISSTQTKPSA